ncbi:hypothetical protein ACLB2K_058305 [Fragaria x ananassa]
MASAIASLSTAFQAASSNLLLSNSSRLKIEIERGAATKDDHSYLVLHGGPWHYKNTRLVLGKYDRRGYPAVVPLYLLEAWVDVQGLPHLLRNPTALRMVGTGLGRVIKFDPHALKRKEEI